MQSWISLRRFAGCASLALLASACRSGADAPDVSAPIGPDSASMAHPTASASVAQPGSSPSVAPPVASTEPKAEDGPPGERLERVDTSNSASGTLMVKRRDANSMDFSLLVINGFYIGELEGTAKRRGSVLEYTEPDRGEGSCVVTFVPSGPEFRVTEKGICPHGAGVDFDGVYRPPPPKVRPSFDCKKARSPVEVLICSDEVLGDLDREMDRLYRAQKEAATDDDKALVAAQKKWLADLSSCVGTDNETGVRCLVRRYLGRLGALDGDATASESTPPALYPTMRAAVDGGTFGTVLAKPKVAGTLRVLLGPKFYTLRDYMGSISARIDNGYACVRGGPPGLFTILEGLVMVGPKGDVWAAILSAESAQVELYGPESKSSEAPPAVFDSWRDRFKEVTVVRHDVRYQP